MLNDPHDKLEDDLSGDEPVVPEAVEEVRPAWGDGKPSRRYKLTIAYRGTAYYGWQWQCINETWKGPRPKNDELPTIEGVMSRVLGEVLGHPVTLCGSSRTDTGVHAKAQVAHMDTTALTTPAFGILRAANVQLPDDIVIKAIESVPRTFNAIRDAVEKRYQYYVWNDELRNPMLADFAFHRWRPLDLEKMQDAAARIQGTHDFSSFARPKHERATTVRTVSECSVSRVGPRLVIGVTGTGFLWNMVRIIAGTILEVGSGKFKPEEIDTMIAARDRKSSGSTAPANGLFLQWIKFAQRQ